MGEKNRKRKIWKRKDREGGEIKIKRGDIYKKVREERRRK